MRVVIAFLDPEVRSWLSGILRPEGMTVAELDEANDKSPELATADLLIASEEFLELLEVTSAPRRRMLLTTRTRPVDISIFAQLEVSGIITRGTQPAEVIMQVREAVTGRIRSNQIDELKKGHK